MPAAIQIVFSVDECDGALLFRKQPEPGYLLNDDGPTTNRPSAPEDSRPESWAAFPDGVDAGASVRPDREYGCSSGEPILNGDLRVVRVARLGGGSDPGNVTRTDGFELKTQVRDLFDELERLQDGTVFWLEFRHGLPFLIETAATACS